MISIDEARLRILECGWTNPAVRLPLDQAIGLVLAGEATSDIDSPPHDKSLVDGYALVAASVRRDVVLDVIEEVTAGEVPQLAVQRGTATRIMTGAPLPDGADAVVMVEQTSVDTSTTRDRVRIELEGVAAGQNTMRRGASIREGEVVLEAGHLLRPIDVGLLCEVGQTGLAVYRPPRVAILATGNELVAPERRPSAGQIRNSNGPMLSALTRAARGEPVDLGICRDSKDDLRNAIQQGLDHDVLVLSGGVSAGVLDLVPMVLDELGVRQVFHKVRLKPGKPMWFGMRSGEAKRTLVFGLPGNPVSSLVCFELFVAPVLRKMCGRLDVVPAPLHARLACEHHHRSDRPTYVPSVVNRTSGSEPSVTPVAWVGSADQRAVGLANCLAFLPPGEQTFAAGTSIEIHML